MEFQTGQEKGQGFDEVRKNGKCVGAGKLHQLNLTTWMRLV